ncbi:MAG TPA: response regulator, partial [Terriglobales bacterium]
GLYIARELVQSHGGKIWVESALGAGSTFCFSIPKEQPLEAIHVLFVDDDPRMREVMSEALGYEGFRVTTASDGAIALGNIKRELPDIVVMDLGMPNMDGAETLKQIRQNWGLLPVILHTGFSNTAIMKKAMEFSPFTLLAKPCAITQLSQTIRSLLPQKTYLREWKQVGGDRPLRRVEQNNPSPQPHEQCKQRTSYEKNPNRRR